MPRNKTRKGKSSQQEEDKLFMKSEKKAEQRSKWLTAMEENEAEQEQPEFVEPKKKKPTFDFSSQNQYLKEKDERLRKKQQLERLIAQAEQESEEQLSDKQTDQEKAERLRKAEIKKERRLMKKQRERELRRMENEDDQKVLKSVRQVQQNQVQSRSRKDLLTSILTTLLFVAVFYFFYSGQVYQRTEHFRLTGQNLYDVLEADSALSDTQLKAKYKKLLLKYHPDKNRECKDCKDKFAKITAAWEVLGNPQKRQQYDSTSGVMNKIKSSSVTLTPDNYHRLIDTSDQLWIIQVYDSTVPACHHYSGIWQQIVKHYEGIARFGRIDVWSQQQMLEFVPYRFSYYPSIYSSFKGHTDIYELNFNNPIGTLKKFIESQMKVNMMRIETPGQVGNLFDGGKIALVIPSNKQYAPYTLRALGQKYEDFLNIATIDPKNTELITKMQLRGPRIFFSQTDSQPAGIPSDHESYLQIQHTIKKALMREMSICKLMDACSDQVCLLILDDDAGKKVGRTLYQKVKVTDRVFYEQLDKMKRQTGQLENFQIAIYMDGKIALGYVEDIDSLTLDEGELLELQCKKPIPVKYWKIVVGLLLFAFGVRNRGLGALSIISLAVGGYFLAESYQLYRMICE